MLEDDETHGARRSQSAAGAWRRTGAVIARSAEGPLIGRLEGRAAADTRSLLLDLARARGEARRCAYLLAAAGHDLRQPLQVMLIALRRVAPHLEDATGSEWLRIASTAAETMTESLTDLAYAARLSGVERQEVELGDLIRQAAESWRHHAAIRSVRLAVVDTEVRVRSDPRLLATVIRNLVGNAVGHTKGGRVLVGVRRAPQAVRIDVLDTGPGLPPGEAERLFEPHWRGDEMAGGLGLGLAIVRDTAERLGGVLTVASTPARGARFSLAIPRRPGRSA